MSMHTFTAQMSLYIFMFPLKDDPPSPEEQELQALKESLQDTQPVGVLANCCKTLDQVGFCLCCLVCAFCAVDAAYIFIILHTCFEFVF